MALNTPNKSGAAYHLKSYKLFRDFMDRDKYGTVMLVLREKDLPLASARVKAGADLVDIFAIGPTEESVQVLNLHTLRKGDHQITLTHTYQYWAQPATLREFLQEQYHLTIPGLSRSKKENGLLTCIELDGNHECYLPGRYIIKTFRLFPRNEHHCPEETAMDPAPDIVATAEHKKDSVCPYCIADKLNINI